MIKRICLYWAFFFKHAYWFLIAILYPFYSHNNEKKNILVSLASFPARIKIVHYTIISLAIQTIQPKQIILWLSQEEFQEQKLPLMLRITVSWINFFHSRAFIEIRKCENIKSFKKLLPALKCFPEMPIVTADDDAFYDRNWLRLLWECHQKFPQCICTHWATQIPSIPPNAPYKKWKMLSKEEEPSFLNLAIGVSGTLYPPHSLDNNVFNLDIINKLEISNDDFYFWCMALLQRTKTVLVKHSLGHPQPSIDWKKTTNLWQYHVEEGYNDIQIQTLIRHWKLQEKIRE